MATSLPSPDSIAQQHSDQLVSLIKQKIDNADGKIDFAEYMNLCLYAPGLGYYSAGSYKLGEKGDFTTAPERSSLFSRSLAQHIIDVLVQITQPSILEFGAGSGKMAADILLELELQQSLPEQYCIIEASADLQYRQRRYLEKTLSTTLFEKIIWLDSLPETFSGVIVANEVCDAMPIQIIRSNASRLSQRFVGYQQQQFIWLDEPISDPDLSERANHIQTLMGHGDFITEVNLTAEAWIASLANSLDQGAMFVIDYGYPQADFYHPQRYAGSLMCYYQHQAHDDPFILQGIQDITAHVDFTGLAQSAFDHSLDVAGFQSQADFLIAGGITDLIEQADSVDSLSSLELTTQLKQLTLPSAMGESFKALTLTKQLPHVLPRLQLADRRYRL